MDWEDSPADAQWADEQDRAETTGGEGGEAWEPADDGDWGDGDRKSGGGGGWDDQAPVEIPVLKRQASVSILDEAALFKMQARLIQQTSDLLDVTQAEASCLLRHYLWSNAKVRGAGGQAGGRGLARAPSRGGRTWWRRWLTCARAQLQQDWFADSAAVRTKVGLSLPQPPRTGMVQCQTAFCDEVPAEQTYQLNCGHAFCLECWRNFIASELGKGRTSVLATCMGMRCDKAHNHNYACSCKEMVPEAVFERFASDQAAVTLGAALPRTPHHAARASLRPERGDARHVR